MESWGHGTASSPHPGTWRGDCSSPGAQAFCDGGERREHDRVLLARWLRALLGALSWAAAGQTGGCSRLHGRAGELHCRCCCCCSESCICCSCMSLWLCSLLRLIPAVWSRREGAAVSPMAFVSSSQTFRDGDCWVRWLQCSWVSVFRQINWNVLVRQALLLVGHVNMCWWVGFLPSLP